MNTQPNSHPVANDGSAASLVQSPFPRCIYTTKTHRSVAVGNKKVRSRLSAWRHAAHTAGEFFTRTGPSTLTGPQVKASFVGGGGSLPPKEPDVV